MPEYRVIWEIDIDAPNPLAAALQAEEYQGAAGSRVHTVIDEACKAHQVDLDNIEEGISG